MSLPDFEHLRAGRTDCPSDLALDRFFAHELDDSKAKPIEKHVADCDACTARMEERRAGFDALDVDPRRMLSRIRTAVAEQEESSPLERAMSWLRKALLPLTMGAAAAASIGLFVTNQHHTGDDGSSTPGIRLKGGLELYVFRLAENGAERVTSGEDFKPGDHIRFAVDLPSDGFIKILGVEATGNLYTAWPLDEKTALQHAAGKNVELPGAVALDDALGRETLYLVSCPKGAGAPKCTSAGPEQHPTCQPGCDFTSFVLEKKP